MRKIIFILSAAASICVLTLAMSMQPNESYYLPVYMERAELEKSVKYDAEPREMTDPGKIYVKGSYIYVNERYKGIHVINNSNPRNPVRIGYIIAPGCLDMAVKENIMYIDNAVDLVAFDLNTKQVTKRIINYFPERMAPNGQYAHYSDRPKDYILVGWQLNSSGNK